MIPSPDDVAVPAAPPRVRQAETADAPRVAEIYYRGIAERAATFYVDRSARGRGVGKALVTRLIAVAAERGYWKLVSRIFPFNAGSLALCRSCGFREVGVYARHGKLDGRWLDVVIVERLIPENQT